MKTHSAGTQSSPKIEAPIQQLDVAAYCIPTDGQEADGTYSWGQTTLVLVQVRSGSSTGTGYTYADKATACLIDSHFRSVVLQHDAMAVSRLRDTMVASIRNLGRPGISSMAISAIDMAVWDLKARLLGLPLVTLLGQAHAGVPVYGSGGFTSYSIERLKQQLASWAAEGIPRVKMKIGAHPRDDLNRVRAAREAIGPDVALFVDANGADSETGGVKTFAIIFATGDEAIKSLQAFAQENRLAGSHFTAIGAFQQATLGYFEWDNKEYKRIPIHEQVEVLSLVGDVAMTEKGEPKIHAHVVVGRADGSTRGGHLLEAIVRPTLELILTESPQPLQRRHDPESGLGLIRF